MKYKIVIVLLIAAVAWVVGRQNASTGVRQEPQQAAAPSEQTAAPDEMRESYPLSPGARVEVRGINGSVEINTAETDTADVQVTYAGGGEGREGGRRVVVDLEAVDFIDSAGLGVLVAGLKRARTRGGALALVATGLSVTKVLEITGLHRIIDVHETREEALAR